MIATSPKSQAGGGLLLSLRRSARAFLHPPFAPMGGDSAGEQLGLAGEEDAARRRVATLVAGARPLVDVYAAVCDETARLVGALATAVLRAEAAGGHSVVATGGSGVVLACYLEERRHLARPALEAPIVVNDRQWGILGAWWPEHRRRGARATSAMASLADLIGVAVAVAERRSELEASRARIIANADENRRRLERDLHDGAQQQLVRLAIELHAAEAAVPAGQDALKRQLGRACAEVNSVITGLQETVRGVHPAVLSQGGLRPALKGLAGRCPLPVHRRVSLDVRLPQQHEIALYYVVSEALTNVVKHAAASAVWIELGIEASRVRLSIRDDGVGGATPAGGSGLLGLRDRIEALGGWFRVDSPHGGGTVLRAILPLADRSGNELTELTAN